MPDAIRGAAADDVVQQAMAVRRHRDQIDTLFLGSPEALLSHLVDEHDLSPADLRRIAKRLADQSKKSGGDA